MTSASSVICHDSTSIVTTTSTRLITLLTTPDRVEVNARCAPITSLFSLETSEPVLVREEGEWHPLHVPEDEAAEVIDQALADARGVPALGQGQSGLPDGDQREDERELGDQGAVARNHAVVDDPLEQQRGGHDESGADDDEDQEQHDLAGVRPCERHHPTGGALLQPAAPLRGVLAAVLVHHPHRAGRQAHRVVQHPVTTGCSRSSRSSTPESGRPGRSARPRTGQRRFAPRRPATGPWWPQPRRRAPPARLR